jgi:hypothetical protein
VHGPIVASLGLGLVWYLWHLPLYIATDRFEMTPEFLAGYAIINVAFSLLHTWFFLRSGGSAFLAVVFHTAGNYSIYLMTRLFPALEGTPVRRVHLLVLGAAGLCAAIALLRRDRPAANVRLSS